MALIEVKEVKKIYADGDTETAALDGVNLTVEKGEFLAIMGPSGSGKSTLLHVLGFLDRNSAGSYEFDGKSMDEMTENELAQVRNEKMGFIFQSFNLLGRNSVLDNVKLPLLYTDKSALQADKLARKAVKEVELEHRMGHEPSELSGGEKQRVAIARALVNNPLIIFADEPTGNLDSKSGENIMDLLYKLNKEGKTILLITHERYTAEYAHRIIHLKDGKIYKEEIIKKSRGTEKGFRK